MQKSASQSTHVFPWTWYAVVLYIIYLNTPLGCSDIQWSTKDPGKYVSSVSYPLRSLLTIQS